MFCQKCGCRIPASADKCPECGSKRPSTEFCSGFWAELNQNTGEKTIEASKGSTDVKQDAWQRELDLTDRNKNEEEKAKAAMSWKEQLKISREKPEKKAHLLQVIEAVIIIILLLCIIPLRNALNNKTDKITLLEQNLKEAETELQKLRDSGQSTGQHEMGDLSLSEGSLETVEEEPALELLPEVGNAIHAPDSAAERGNTKDTETTEQTSSFETGTTAGEKVNGIPYQVPQEFMQSEELNVERGAGSGSDVRPESDSAVH